MSGINVQRTLQDFWATRPRRPDDDRKIGGVAAAIGRRYAVDPVLVRVGFVVATLFSAAGVLLYLLGWLLLPAETDQDSAAESLLGRGRSSMSPALTVLLILLLIPASGAVFGGPGSGVLGLAVAVGTLVLLHHSRARLGEVPGSSAPEGPPEKVPGTPGTNPLLETNPAQRTNPAAGTNPPPGANTTAGGADQPGPPAWDPLGAAPFAWDLPEPSPEPAPQAPPARRSRLKITPIALGLALLTGGIASAFWPALPAAQIAALLLGVIGLGLVVGSLVHGGRGLIAIAIPLALLTWVLQAVPASGLRFGDGRWSPVTAAQLQPRYALTMGDARLDLRKLQLTQGQQVKTSVTVGMGVVRVILPPNVDAEVSCQTQAGHIDCLDVTDDGAFPARVTKTDLGADGLGGGRLILDVRSGAGEVRVDRVNRDENGADGG